MEITQKTYRRWLNYAKIVTSNRDFTEDILHDFIINIIEKEVPDEKLTDNYVFISLRNRFLTHIGKDKTTEFPEEMKEIPAEEEIDYHAKDNIIKDKLKSIEEVVLSLRSYEQTLYKLHFIYGLSQREIAREIGISHTMLNKRINKIKSKIQINFDAK